jgi:hypothetical protein
MKYLLTLLLFLSSQAFAQPKANAVPQHTAPAKRAQDSVGTKPMSEKDYYKMMYEQAAKSSDSSTTITWSALRVVIGAVGFILLANYRLNTSRIKEEVATQGTETQRAVLAAVSTQIAADLLATQSRVQDLERQLREATNREMDRAVRVIETQLQPLQTEVLSIKESANDYKHELAFRDAQDLLIVKKEPFNALQKYLQVAAIKINESTFDNAFFLSGDQFIRAMDELQESDVKKIENIIEILEKNSAVGFDTLRRALENKPVYRHLGYTKQYIKNPPH